MQSCLLEGKQIYAFDILGKNDTVHFEREKEYRLASKKNMLKCCGCGDTVIFKFRNLKKRIPHFAHLNQSNTQSCSYGKETEEHIEGKRIILNRMRELYPEIHHQMRYKVKSINRFADLFFQLNDQQLIIEFQRTDLDFDIFEEKIKDYHLSSINSLWLLSGNKEDFENITREHNLTFFQRANLNAENRPILFLNVDNRTITMMVKFEYRIKETKEIYMDRLFYKTYSVDDIVIKLSGTIESDFEESCRTKKTKFFRECQERIEIEEKNQINKTLSSDFEDYNRAEQINLFGERGEKIELVKKSPIDKGIDYTQNTENNLNGKYLKRNKNKINPESVDIYYKIYKNHVYKLLNNYTEDLYNIISGACYNNSTVYQMVKELLKEEIDRGNIKAKTILNSIDEFIGQSLQ